MEMTCPKCRGAMRQYERSGVTVDQCNECRGIFLDRGELERLMDAEAAFNQAPSVTPPPPQARPVPTPPPPPPQPGYGRGYGHDPYRQKRRKSFLEELFD